MKLQNAIKKFQSIGFEGGEDHKSMMNILTLEQENQAFEVGLIGIDKVNSITIKRFNKNGETQFNPKNVKQAVEFLQERI